MDCKARGVGGPDLPLLALVLGKGRQSGTKAGKGGVGRCLCKHTHTSQGEWGRDRQAGRALPFIPWERSGAEKVGASGAGLLEARTAKGHPADWRKVPRVRLEVLCRMKAQSSLSLRGRNLRESFPHGVQACFVPGSSPSARSNACKELSAVASTYLQGSPKRNPLQEKQNKPQGADSSWNTLPSQPTQMLLYAQPSSI